MMYLFIRFKNYWDWLHVRYKVVSVEQWKQMKNKRSNVAVGRFSKNMHKQDNTVINLTFGKPWVDSSSTSRKEHVEFNN